VKVPLSIIYRKDVERDGSAPLYLQAYGAYAIDIDPAFHSPHPALARPRRRLCRGPRPRRRRTGRELDQAGMKLTKPTPGATASTAPNI